MSSASGSTTSSQDEGWQQVTKGRKTIQVIRPGQPGAAEAMAAAAEQQKLSRKQQQRKERRKAAAAQFRAEVTEPLQAATNASKVELGLVKPSKNSKRKQRQRQNAAAAAAAGGRPQGSAHGHAPAPAAAAAPAAPAASESADAEDEGFGDIQIPLATSAPAKVGVAGGPAFVMPETSRAFVPMNAMAPVAPVPALPAASPALTPPPPCVSPSLWLVNKDAFKSEQQTRARLLQALGAVDGYPPMGKEYPKVDLEELCNALNVPIVPNILTRETATKEEILEDAFLVLAYALEQCNEHVYIQKLMPKYLSTLPADDNVKATINTDTPLVDAYMRAKTTTRLNVDWKTGRLCAPIFNPEAAAAAGTAEGAAAAAAAAAGATKKKQHRTKYDKWMEALGWNSMNKTRQLYTLWNNYFVTSGRKDVWEVATDVYGLDKAADPDEQIAKLKADGLVGPVGQLPFRLPVWTNQKEWKKAPAEQHKRHIDWRAYEHNLSDGHCIMVARLTRVFGEPWTVRNSIHHLGKFLKQFREVVRIKEGLNHLHEKGTDPSGVEDPIVRSSSPAPPALSSVAHVITEMKKVVTVCGPHIILLPQMMALTSGPVEGCENDASADHSKDTLNGTVLATHPVIGKILPHASRILMDYYFQNAKVDSPVMKASETPDEMYALTDDQLYQYNLVRILWAVQQVAVDISGATLAIVFRNEVGHACEHAELGYRDGYKIVCAVHGYLRIPSRPSTPSGRGSRPSTPIPHRSTTPTSPRSGPAPDAFSSPTKK